MQAASTPFGLILGGNDFVVEDEVDLMLPVRTNLCPNPNFEHGTLGSWQPSGGATASISTAQHQGTEAHSLFVGWANGAAANGNAVNISFPTIIGQTYTVSVKYFIPTGQPAGQISLYGVLGTGISTTNAWTSASLSFTAAKNFATLRISNNTTIATTGQGIYITDAMIEQSATFNSYFDGDTAGCAWEGVAGNSASDLNLFAYPNASLAVESIEVDREITTDMPDGTRLIAGYPAATADIILSGSLDANDLTQTPASLFNPYNALSVLYRGDAVGAKVTSKSGLYTGSSNTPELITTFTGTLDDYEYDPITGTVELYCIDYRTKLKTAPGLPSFSGQPAPSALNTFTPFLTAHYGLDYLLRSAGIYSSPPPRAGSMFFASMHGSMWPEISGPLNGVGPLTSGAPANWAAGKWSPQTVALPCATYAQLDLSETGPVAAGVTNGMAYMEMTGAWDPSTVSAGSFIVTGHAVTTSSVTANYKVKVSTDGAGHLVVSAIFTPYNLSGAGTPQGSTVNYSETAGDFTVGVQFFWTSPTSLTVTIFVNNEAANVQTFTFTSGHTDSTHTELDSMHFENDTSLPVENICISTEYAGNTYASANFVPTAYLDASLNTNLTCLPDVTGNDSWQVIQQICDAETAVGGFDENGVFRFQNRVTLRGVPNSGVLDGQINLETAQIGMMLSTVANHVQVPVNVQAIQAPSAIWQATDTIAIDAGQSVVLNVTLQSPAINVALTDSGVTPSGGGTPGLTTFRASSDPFGNGAELTAINISIVQISPTELQITAHNNYVFAVYLVTPAGYVDPQGSPALTIGGQTVSAGSTTATDITDEVAAGVLADWQWPPLTEGGAVTNKRGEILITVASNVWQQDYNTALILASDIGGDLIAPRPIITNITIVADPRIQLVDRRTLNLTDQGITGDVTISGVTFNSSATQFDQTLVVRAVSRPGDWIMGDTVYSVMGATTYA